MRETSNNQVQILGTKLSLFDQSTLLHFIHSAIKNQNRCLITSGNVHAYNLAYHQTWLQTFINQADVVRLDGVGVKLGARLLGYDTPARMTWADFGWELADFSAQNNFSMFFLGGKPGVANKAAQKLREKYPSLVIAGTQHGYYDKTRGSKENTAVLSLLAEAQPDMLLVGFGMPLQEQWIKENYDDLPANVIFTVGAAFDYISGELKRAPRWMTDHGLEWLGRMLIEPKRLWRRYIVGNPLFLYRVLLQRFGLLKE